MKKVMLHMGNMCEIREAILWISVTRRPYGLQCGHAVESESMANEADINKDPEAAESRVTGLELFFDLVFVFTLTQLSALLARSLSWESLLQSFLIFIVLFWMYGGYVWLTNSVPAVTAARQLLLVAGLPASPR